jgi:SAM-dependent methyltransferase
MESYEYSQLFAHEENHWWCRALRRQFAQAIAGLDLPGPDNIRWLDAGCGTGKTLEQLSQGREGFGLDFSPEALALSRKRMAEAGSAVTPLVRASVEAIPLRDATFDLIISADVLYHRGVADDVAALAEMARCLRPGGYLLVNLPAFSWLFSSHDVPIHTARRYTRGELTAKLVQAGLSPVRVSYWNWLLFPPLALIRLLRKPLRGNRITKSDLIALPNGLNALLDITLKMELKLSAVTPLAGLSVFAVARKD